MMFISPSMVEIRSATVIFSGLQDRINPPSGPLMLFTNLAVFRRRRICSVYSKEIFSDSDIFLTKYLIIMTNMIITYYIINEYQIL